MFKYLFFAIVIKYITFTISAVIFNFFLNLDLWAQNKLLILLSQALINEGLKFGRFYIMT